MDKSIVFEKIKTIKKECRPITNCYSTNPLNSISSFWECEDSFAFSYYDHGIERIIYFASNEEKLKKLIDDIPSGEYYLEFLTKDYNEHADLFSREMLVAKMKRLVNNDCSNVFHNEKVMKFEDSAIGSLATIEDAKEINEVLWNVFNTEISHLLTDTEVEQAIARKEFTIHRNGKGEIESILQAVIMPRKFYTNQIVNYGEKKTINAMLINRIKEYYETGGRYLYSWVAEDNIASMKLFEKYGHLHDGTWNMVYRLER